SGQENAELPKERKGHQVDGVDGGTKILKNRSAQKRDNGPHQKGQQRDDRQGIQAGVVNGGNERRKAPARRTGKNEKQRGEGFPDKAGKLPGEPGNRGDVLPEFSEKSHNRMSLRWTERITSHCRGNCTQKCFLLVGEV